MDPVTIAIAAMAAVGNLLHGISAYAEGKTVQRQMKYRAIQAEQDAGIKATVALGQADKVGGEAAVDAAANGAGLGSSAQDALDEIGRRGMFNARSALYAGKTAADNATYQGTVARRQGALSLISSTVEAGAALAGGFKGGPSPSLAAKAGQAGDTGASADAGSSAAYAAGA